LDSLQIGTISFSLVPSGIRAGNPWTSTMAPYTRAADFKRIEDSIAAVSQDNSQKYELMADLLKGQNAKLDQTIKNQDAQIRDIRSLMGIMAQ
jgi:hypothetical protein